MPNATDLDAKCHEVTSTHEGNLSRYNTYVNTKVPRDITFLPSCLPRLVVASPLVTPPPPLDGGVGKVTGSKGITNSPANSLSLITAGIDGDGLAIEDKGMTSEG
jgi:hypothetical protein